MATTSPSRTASQRLAHTSPTSMYPENCRGYRWLGAPPRKTLSVSSQVLCRYWLVPLKWVSSVPAESPV